MYRTVEQVAGCRVRWVSGFGGGGGGGWKSLLTMCGIIGTQSFHAHNGPEGKSAYNRNEFQKVSWGKAQPGRKGDKLAATCKRIV
jgi:hypothetical protein